METLTVLDPGVDASEVAASAGCCSNRPSMASAASGDH